MTIKLLWATYIFALAASVSHVAWAFGTLEQPGWGQFVGWLAAIAVDLGLAVLAYGIQQRKRAGRSARDLWIGVIFFALISAFANILHAVAIETGGKVVLETFNTLDHLTLAKAIFLSASLPLLVIYLSEIVSADDARKAQAAIDDALKARRKAERAESKAESARIKAQAKAEAELKAKTKQEASEQAAQASAFKCETCEAPFATIQARSAHMRAHKPHANGTERATERTTAE